MKRLSEVAMGKAAVIVSFDNNDIFLKLMEMGCVPGEIVRVQQVAPLGDPIAISVSGYNLSLRLDEARHIFVEDLVDAFILAQKNIDKISGTAFNMGGGPKNTVSLVEILSLISEKTGKQVDISFEGWRTGDQQYYVSDTAAFQKATGWKPRYTVAEGIEALTVWLCNTRKITLAQNVSSKAVEV